MEERWNAADHQGRTTMLEGLFRAENDETQELIDALPKRRWDELPFWAKYFVQDRVPKKSTLSQTVNGVEIESSDDPIMDARNTAGRTAYAAVSAMDPIEALIVLSQVMANVLAVFSDPKAVADVVHADVQHRTDEIVDYEASGRA